jgi:hypothetical protein
MCDVLVASRVAMDDGSGPVMGTSAPAPELGRNESPLHCPSGTGSIVVPSTTARDDFEPHCRLPSYELPASTAT